MTAPDEPRRSATIRATLIVAAVALLAMVAGSCSGAPNGDRGATGPLTFDPGTIPGTVPDASRPRLDLASVDPSRRAVITDLQRYWGEKVTEQTGRTFRPLADENLHPFDDRSLPPACDAAKRVTYEQLKGNAYFCPASGSVAWDEGELFPRLERDIGPAATKLVLAHEWGHAVQQQLDIRGPSILLELQADCFAGMWMGESAVQSGLLDENDFAQALTGLLQLSDRLEVLPHDPSAHGSPFDRTVAFRDGLESRTCFEYPSRPPVVAALDVVGSEPTRDMAFEEALAELTEALNQWYAARPGFEPITELRAFERDQAPALSCGTETQVSQVVSRFNFWLCPSSHLLLYDGSYLRRTFDGLGIGGLVVALAVQWDGLAAGFREQAPGFSNLLGYPFRECFAGAFLADNARAPTTGIRVSLEELNGAVGYVLLQPDRPDDGGVPVLLTSFFALRYLENGVRQGTAACGTTPQ